MKRIIAILIAMFSINVTVSAVNQELQENIRKAEEKYSAAYFKMYKLAGETFLIYEKEKGTQRSFRIEKILRSKYPETYTEYINAKMELDDLIYSRYLGEIVNPEKTGRKICKGL